MTELSQRYDCGLWAPDYTLGLAEKTCWWLSKQSACKPGSKIPQKECSLITCGQLGGVSSFSPFQNLGNVCDYLQYVVLQSFIYMKNVIICLLLNTVQWNNWCIWWCKAITVQLSIHLQHTICSVCKCRPLHPFYWDTSNKLNQCWWHICQQLLAVMDIGHNIWSQTCTVCHTNTALRSGHSSTQLYSWWNSHTRAEVWVGRYDVCMTVHRNIFL